MYIQNKAPLLPDAVNVPYAGSHTWPNLRGGDVDGPRTVQVKFRDMAGNWGNVWAEYTIQLDVNAPSWPGSAQSQLSATPFDIPERNDGYDGAIQITFPEQTGVQNYGLNWQRTTDFPYYDVPMPDFPPAIGSDFQGPHDIQSSPYVFETIGLPGIYFMSIWFQDMAGHWSTNHLEIATQDYFGGDFDLDGGLRIDEWLQLREHYYSEKGVVGDYEDTCDIGPTSTGWVDGYVQQDDIIDFKDLYIYTFNYDFHPLEGERRSMDDIPTKPEKRIVEGLLVSAEVPESFQAGQQFDAVIRIDNPDAVKCLSLVLNYDPELLEAVTIEPGDMFDDRAAHLLNRIGEQKINLDGTVLGFGAKFSGSEVAHLRFRAKSSGSFAFSEPIMELVDHNGQSLDVAFSNVFGDPLAKLPTAFSLKQNYPNPFNPATTIEFAIPKTSEWRIDIFNVVGQRVKSFTGTDEAGVISVIWDGSNAFGDRVASGIYFYRASALSGEFVETKKMVLMK
jgi:hypothetical protein